MLRRATDPFPLFPAAQGCRFVPSRAQLDVDAAGYLLSGRDGAAAAAREVVDPPGAAPGPASPHRDDLRRRLADAQRGAPPSPLSPSGRRMARHGAAHPPPAGTRILHFKAPAPPASSLPPGLDGGYAPADLGLEGLLSANAGPSAPRQRFRVVPSHPDRILDAPGLADDYYLNLLAWGASGRLAVALGPAVYVWDASTGAATELLDLSRDDGRPGAGGPTADAQATSVAWAADGRHLAVGTAGGDTQVWDAEAGRQVRRLRGHAARVGAVGWAPAGAASGGSQGHRLATGGRDGRVLEHDVRVRSHLVASLEAHAQEVCGLAWAPSGAHLATGGNDNLLAIWDVAGGSGGGAAAAPAAADLGGGPARRAPLHRLEAHAAAVKALSWCPFQSGVLASGGGSADRTIRTWNAATGAQLDCVDTGSQVCSLQWAPNGERELLSSHGYARNELAVWRYPSLTRAAELRGHGGRVLATAVSPDGRTVASAGADETLRFWPVWGPSGGAGDRTTAAAEGKGEAGGRAALRARTLR